MRVRLFGGCVARISAHDQELLNVCGGDLSPLPDTMPRGAILFDALRIRLVFVIVTLLSLYAELMLASDCNSITFPDQVAFLVCIVFDRWRNLRPLLILCLLCVVIAAPRSMASFGKLSDRVELSDSRFFRSAAAARREILVRFHRDVRLTAV